MSKETDNRFNYIKVLTSSADNIFIASGYAPVSVSGNRNLYTGQMTVNTFNGKLFFSNTAWAGRVVSYTDSRII